MYGDLDSTELLIEESSKADIILHSAHADHVAGAKAIVEGLSKRTGQTPAYLIHTSGTGILCYTDLDANTYGVRRDKIYDDWDGVGEVTSLKDTAPHRDVDKIILAAGTGELSARIKTAIVCPPTIYGPGHGPGNKRSQQAYNLSQFVLEQGHGVVIEAGENIWTQVHVHDLGRLYLNLVEAAVNGGGKATWGAEGYYFAENGEFVWGELAQKIADAAQKQGLIDSNQLIAMDWEKMNKLKPGANFGWGTNSRARAIRARKLFDWNPVGRSLFDEVPDIVSGEAKRLGLAPKSEVQARNEV